MSTNAAGSGNIAGIGVDKEGSPGSGEPGKYMDRRTVDLAIIAMLRRLTNKNKNNKKSLNKILKG